MVTGRQIYSQLQRELVGAESGFQSLTRLNQKKTIELIRQKEVLFVELAKQYLPKLDTVSVQDACNDIQFQLYELIKERKSKRTDIEQRLLSCQETRSELIRRQYGVQRNIDELTAKIFRLEPKFEGSIAASDELKRLESEKLKGAALLDKFKGRLQELEREVKEKLPPYEQESLFRYLLKINFGESGYKPSWPFSVLDKWIARKVDFARAKENYLFLTQTPALLKNEVERREKEFAFQEDKYNTVVAKISEMSGMSSLKEEREISLADMDELVRQLELVDRRIENLESDLSGLSSEAYQKAIRVVTKFLSASDISYLQTKAAVTEASNDDRLVQLIEGIEGRLNELSPESAFQRKSAKQLSELRKLERNFTKKGYQSRGSYFHPGFDLSDVLKGEFSFDDVFKALKKQQKFTKSRPGSILGGGFGKTAGAIFSSGDGF